MPEKKSRRRKDARPEEIISAAIGVFAEKGFGATSIGDIAKRADIARSTVYLYFADKDALIRTAFQERIGSMFSEQGGLLQQMDMPFETVMRRLLFAVYKRLGDTENLVLFRILMAEGNQLPELVKFYHQTIMQNAEKVLRAVIAQGIAQGAVRPEVADYDPKVLVAPTILAGIWQLTFEQVAPLDLDKYINSHLEILMKGILIGSEHAPS
jgi:AcrR family transcriptional regulator